MTDPQDNELLNIFWVEVGDYLQKLNSLLLQTEASSQTNPEAVREMNRFAHSMKGAARAVGIGVIETLSHYMEDIFGAALKSQLELTPTTCDLLYDSLDLIQNVVNGIDNSSDALAATIARLEQTIASESEAASENHTEQKRSTNTSAIETAIVRDSDVPAPAPTPKPPSRTITSTSNAGHPSDDMMTVVLPTTEESVRVPVSRMDRLMGEVSELLVARMHSEERAREFHRLQKLNQRWQREWRSVRTAYIRLARRMQHEQGEMWEEVITLFHFLEENQRYLQETQRQLAHLSRELTQYNASLTMLTEQLQDDISGMRLVPFDTVVSSFQRLIRDLARDTSKEVHLAVEGATVEMDKTALDALKEPIMHLLRNSVDHGIEHPAEREQNGKLPIGSVHISVEQRGKEIIIRVSDDGRGLDTTGILRKAEQLGIVNPQAAADLSPEEVYNLIFHPGLSTAAELTAISGRGMGMDIVRIRVESLRGRVSVQSALGRGTTFTMRLPVSLTRLSCILLQVGGQDFAVPSVSVWRMLKLRRDQWFTAEGRDMVIIEERPIPVISLAGVLGNAAGPEAEEIPLMVLASGEKYIAFQVDDLYSEQELVLKPLGPEITNAPYISGGALLGTGDVIIVLDPNDLIRGASGQPRIPRRIEKIAEPVEEKRLRVLIADDSITTRTLEKHILETAGYEVHVAVDGMEAWERLRELQPDVVISDVEMPRMTGLELAARIKGDEQTRRIPVVLLTSLGKPQQQEAGLKAGADAYLVKSRFEQGELLRVIRSVV
ncbi:MAG: response regulator [Anaerolineaceae bacterium]|nr:response regulator [Anaerolineaceae bacterium]